LIVQAQIENGSDAHAVVLATDGAATPLAIPARDKGSGFAANGGELLCLALATCYCNDIYREAAKRNIAVVRVEVQAQAEFGGPGDVGKNLRYRARVEARASEDDIRALMLHTDRIAEIHATLRRGIEVRLDQIEPISV
jgi:organic hydroperoxide reductase OsmC/OhrA